MNFLELPLVGPGGEPVDLIATLNSHGVTSLAPVKPNGDLATELQTTIRLGDGAVRTIRIGAGSPGSVRITLLSKAETDLGEVADIVRNLLRLNQDLSGFYARTSDDPLLSWVNGGYGRMMRCQTVYEDVIKTILTTNCAWSATVRMTERLVGELGEIDPGFADILPYGRAFPTPAAMADRDETFYREVIRAGYRAPHLVKIATAVRDGDLDLESLAEQSIDTLDDVDLEKQLLALPGVGPYAAAHIMHMLGRSSKLIFDSWTRPTYFRIVGVESMPDAEIIERFSIYGNQAGLAYWMAITKSWFAEHIGIAGDPDAGKMPERAPS